MIRELLEVLKVSRSAAANLAVAAAVFSLSAGFADASTNYVVNGSFETNGGNGQVGKTTTLSNWSIVSGDDGYSFVFASGTADTTGANGQYGNLKLWGPGDGSSNGLPATSPDGGYFVAFDSGFQANALQQTVSGLTPGATYDVGFWWGGAQQQGFNGATWDYWTVSLGTQSDTTATINLPSHGYSAWTYQNLYFTATAPSEVLSFVATGPTGVPPFALLDGVSMTQTPEPGSPMLMITGLILTAIGGIRRGRKLMKARASVDS